MGKDYYSPRPNFLNIGMDPYNKKDIERMESFRNIHDPVRRAHCAPLKPLPQIDERGFMVRNNARLAYTAVFDFVYDDQSKVHSEVSEGNKVFATFNTAKKGEFKIITVEGVITKIEPINNGKDFVIYIDASEENKSSVYKLGSRALLDIGRIYEEGEQKIEDIDPAEVVEEITDDEYEKFPPYAPGPLPPCPPPPGPRPPFPPPGPKPYWPLPKKPDVLTWSDKNIESVKNEELGYEIANITYSKKKPIQTLLIIYSMTGEVVYKAIDNSLKLSSLSNFTWDYRNYFNALHDIPMLDKLENFSVDSTGRIVLTPYDTISDKAKEYIESVQKSNDYFIEPGEYFVEIAAGPDIINYNPLAISEINKDRVAISTKIIVTKEAILNAAYVEPTPEEGEDVTDPVTPENPEEGENADVPSTPDDSGNEGTEENPSDPETPTDSETEDPNKEENNDTSDAGTTESETPTTGNPEETGEEETTDPGTTTTEEDNAESVTE